MNRLILILALAFPVAAVPVLTSCAGLSTPSAKQTQYTTLKVVNEASKSILDGATSLLVAKKISVAQYEEIGGFYDKNFQPVLQAAISAARMDLSSANASTELMALLGQLAAIAETYAPKPPTTK